MLRNQKFLIANWKENPAAAAEAKKIFKESIKHKGRGVSIIICPPSIFLADLIKLSKSKQVSFGVQDIFWKSGGSHTGEISAKMAKSVGASYAIIGHSERRALGESDEIVSRKVLAALGD